jgi:mannose-1-phosphate guanylyltransferase
MQPMDALLLAAGRGSRLGALTESTPKCLVSIAGRPLLDYWLEQLDGSKSISRVFVNVHYLGEKVKEFLNQSSFARKVQVVHENRLWGTGGTVARLVASHGPFEDGLFVAHADNLTLFDLEGFLVSHHSRPEYCFATVMTFETDTPSSCGIFKLNEQNVAVEFFEKVAHPPGRLANGAVFAFSNGALAALCGQFKSLQTGIGETEEVFDLSRDFLPKLIGKLWTFRNNFYHRDIGTPASLDIANADFPGARARFLTGQTEF